MVMDEEEQVAAYASSGRSDGIMAAAKLFHSARVCSVIAPCRRILDLGCGPATQLVQIAQLNPEKSFVGVELSPRMLLSAQEYVAATGVANIELRQGDITTLDGFADGSFDAVISTMTLHHLPTVDYLRQCARQIKRVLRPGGAIYLADFGRLKSPASVHFFSHLHEHTLPRAVVTDYVHSMNAAFSIEEYRQVFEHELGLGLEIVSTFGARFMLILKTADAPIPAALRRRFADLRADLAPEFAQELDNLRLFFRLGGLGSDPFH